MTKPRLSENHRRMLFEESGIDPEVAEARGYRTVEKKVELERLGFGRKQRNVPALLIPVHSPSGGVTLYQSRPDEPRVNEDGDPVKYDTPKGSRMTLDAHPSMRDKMGDPTVPLWITEGIKKGDALTSRGLCAATLLGVWSWRGTNEHGGKTALPEWDCIALNGRRVYIVFDSDVMVKPQVHQALSRFKGFLESRGAEVRVVYLPHGEGGKKQGVDDFFVAGHGVEDLLSHAAVELRAPHGGEHEAPPEVYEATPSGIVWNKPTRDGVSPTSLTNFTARIVSDVVEDDGAEERHTFEVEALVGGRVRRFEVPASSFASMGWVARHLGAGAFVYPGWGYEKHAAVAIQSLSGEIAESTIFAHAGWRQIGAETGRMSCSKPALQQLPPEVKGYVRAPEGRVLVKADYSQIELRIAAKISGDERMLAAYQRGDDLHSLTAKSLASVGVGKEDRKLAKAVNFGLLYGQGARGLKAYARDSYETDITLEEAALYKRRFFETYPGLKFWHERERRALERGNTETRTLAGRRRKGVTKFTEWVNAPVQGTGADGLKLSLAMLWERREECPGAVPVATVHDEIVVECEERDAEKAEAWLKKAMVDGMDEVLNGPGTGDARVPVEVETQIATTWAG